MISTVSLLPSPRTFPHPRCSGAISKCRVGDWEYPHFVEDWWGRIGVQRFQPSAPDPFDPDTFDPAASVWIFERCQHPFVPFAIGECQVWKRIA